MNIAIMVDTTLLSRTFVLIRIKKCAAVVPSYNSLLPMTVMQMRRVLALLGLMDTTIYPYVNIFPSGTSVR